ncbi:hypothetical protein Sa4125_37920 [Aureimonas sp. SA4125]|uniref:hypothetical protein n=1 Tax=Aureimonas sp. SA4125 TaxID=2826993 RepID=UPI001CC6A99A|nr:hypothetical protein [Aureimonas sp. SA4125]BDA86250.1 hypothetical protein Sa4125_37920 [Aureimonas sp. SA4125]
MIAKPLVQGLFRRRKLGMRHAVSAGAVFLALLAGAAWMVRVPPGETPLLRIAGPSFIFNYRVADVYYGFTAEVMRPVPVSSTITAEFEDPAGGPPHRVSEKIFPQTRRYALRSPSLRGVKKGVPYHVTIRLLNRGDEKLLFETRLAARSDLDDALMPTQPLTIGPGYERNPSPRATTENGG